MRIYLLSLLLLCSSLALHSQDSLTTEVLQPLTHSFQVENGKLSGPGADFLLDLMGNSQYTMLGEYHGSKRISELTRALIPELDEMGYKHLVLEVGPNSAQILEELPDETIDGLKKINQKFSYTIEDYENMPIPFFEHVEDAEFLKEAKVRDWNIIGIDQEFCDAVFLLTDRMYNQLADREKHAELYAAANDSLMAYIEDDWNDVRPLFTTMLGSETLKTFTDIAQKEEKNKKLVDDFWRSVEIYALREEGKWFENNRQRIQYMKSEYSKAMEESKFDLKKDKLLIKMGGKHLSKGFSPLELFEVGNMLNELAEFHGNQCLNINFSVRYYMDGDELKDVMDSDRKRDLWYRSVNQMGKKDEWVVIDLRPLCPGSSYYPLQYILEDKIRDMAERYDLLIIPKTEEEPTLNQ